ncbi:uncharacterized protein EDB93DRAFT_1242371 [Suillus bovinus]|uniref:uncharacterized protein n=1 Tax=Suillus bovinus TaxID=48563 RepID=UPI001B8713F9|nr:uncharacterized protein EDB93DRAFT_1242371 [Suillus bovinus]KAG2136504.1 hypothetical protein EDB93DRAFT_1242371 [Suillus bovinus]
MEHMAELATNLEHGFTTFQTLWISTVCLLAPFAYLVLSQISKSVGGRSDKGEAESDTPDHSKFDTSNIRVTKILIHPIKSCKGTSVSEAKYTLHGLDNDRRWSIIRADNNAVVTARDVAKMVLIVPRIIPDPSSPDGGRLEVSFPKESGCEAFSVPLNPTEEELQGWQNVDISLWGKNDIEGYVCQTNTGRSPSEILSQYMGLSVHLAVKGPRPRTCPPTVRFPDLDAPSYFQDSYPLLVVSEESVAAVEKLIQGMVGMQGIEEKWSSDTLQVERFRPNIVIKGAGAPFFEDTMTEFTIHPHHESVDGASSIIQLVRKCTRCVLPNVHPETGIRDKAVPLKILMKHRRGLDPGRPRLPCMGCNGVFTANGVVKVGDWIHVRKTGFV